MSRKVASTKWWTPFKWVRPTDVSETEPFEFDTITLAYEVPIKLVTHDYIKETIKETKVTETIENTCQSIQESSREQSSTTTIKTTTITTTTTTTTTGDGKLELIHLILDYRSTLHCHNHY
jgi:hypothetical protein